MRLSGASVCLAVIAAIATLSACGDSNEPPASSQDLVYYEAFASDSNRIVRVAADGSDRTVLWEGRFLGDLHVAPDGAILFGADGWHLIPAAGGPAAPFAVPDVLGLDQPRWSPDGQWILWRTAGGSYPLGVAAPGSTTLQVITPDSIQAFSTDWSPDAQRIVFSGNNVLRNTYSLYTVARDGSDLRRITPDSLDIAGAPSWSHDGSRIAYPYGYIYTIAPDGSDVRQVTDGPGGGGFSTRLWWSPDDRQMMAGPGPLRRIIVSTGAVQSVGLQDAGGDPWSEDGTRILYLLRTEPDNAGTTWPAVGVANVTGTGNVQVSANGIGSYGPVWLPGSN
jgi:hypothetical protein